MVEANNPAHLMAEKIREREKKGIGSPNAPQGHTASNQKASCWASSFDVADSTTLGAKPLAYRSLGNV
jgi:hypothetical protein